MAKDLLTREELNLLLADDSGPDSRATLLPEAGTGPFSPEDFSNLQKVLATYLIPGVTAWSVLFGRSIELSDPEISLVSAAILAEMDAAVIGGVDFLQGIKGQARFVLPLDGARVLVGMALGSPEPAAEFDLIHRSSFASVLKYLLAEMRSLISRGTGRRVGTSEPIIKLWPDEVLPQSGHLVQARIPWWVEGVAHPPLLFWADLELTRGLLSLVAPKPRHSMSPGESAWSGAGMKKPGDKPLGGGRLAPPAPTAARQGNRLMGRAGASAALALENAAQPARGARPSAEPSDLSIWTLGRGRGQNQADAVPADAVPTNDPEETADAVMAPAAVPQPLQASKAPQPAPAPAAPHTPRKQEARPAPMSIDSSGPGPEQEEQEMRVELGRATLRDPLTLGQVVPLDRLAGESVDIFVDGHLVARGEVTVDGEVLAVRVTQTVPTRRPARGPER